MEKLVVAPSKMVTLALLTGAWVTASVTWPAMPPAFLVSAKSTVVLPPAGTVMMSATPRKGLLLA